MQAFYLCLHGRLYRASEHVLRTILINEILLPSAKKNGPHGNEK
jgi:hypothetical protein